MSSKKFNYKVCLLQLQGPLQYHQNLITEFGAHHHLRISKEYKPLVESINQIQITKWSKDRLSVKHGNKSYIDWYMMTACVDKVLINASYEDMKSKYGIPRSTITGHLINICHSLKCINMRKL